MKLLINPKFGRREPDATFIDPDRIIIEAEEGVKFEIMYEAGGFLKVRKVATISDRLVIWPEAANSVTLK